MTAGAVVQKRGAAQQELDDGRRGGPETGSGSLQGRTLIEHGGKSGGHVKTLFT